MPTRVRWPGARRFVVSSSDGAPRRRTTTLEVPEMNATAADRTGRSVQLAVMRAPTTSVVEAVAEARRAQPAIGLRDVEAASRALVAAAA